MNSPQNSFPRLSALALVSTLAFAQEPTSTRSTATPPSGFGNGHGLRADGPGLLGCGRDYLVRFDANGMHFTPVLGKDAPAVAPLQLGLKSIRRGGDVLPCDLDVAPKTAGDGADYDRSATIRERYELRDAGIEHSFVFDALPGRGDLVVRLGLAGLGAAAVPAQDGGLDFVRADERLVHMGTVTGIDARGERTRGAVRLDGDHVELSLPASFVDHAALPLVLDPWFGNSAPFQVAAGYDSAPHVVWHAQQQRWLCVFERSVSSSQTDVMVRSWSPSAGLGTLVPVGSVSGSLSRAPRIAYHTGSNRCLVVWQQGASEFALHTIEGAVIDGNVAQVTAFQAAAAASFSYTTPDLSGDPTGAGQGVIAFAAQGASNGLRLRPYTLAATGVPTIGAQISLSTNATAVRPRVSRSAGPMLAITWEQKPGNYFFAYLQAVTRAGTLLGAPGALGNIGGPDLHHPDVDGNGTSFMMVLEYQRAFGDRDVSVAQWNWNGSSWGPPVATAAVGQLIGTDESMPTVALLGSKYAIAWEQATGFLTGSVQCRNFALNGCITCGAQVALPFIGSQFQPALAATFAGGGTDDMAMLVCTLAGAAIPPTGDVAGLQWSAHQTATPAVLSPGCGHPMSLSLVGAPGIGNTSFRLSLTTADAQASLGAFLLGIGLSTPRVPCGSCLIVNAVATNLAPLSAGAASYTLAVPCDQSLIGFQIQAQGAAIGSVQNVCPALNTLSMSAALGFSIVE